MGIKGMIYGMKKKFMDNRELRIEEKKADLVSKAMAKSEARQIARMEKAKQIKALAREKEQIRGQKRIKLAREGGIKGKIGKGLKQAQARMRSKMKESSGARDVFGTGSRDVFGGSTDPPPKAKPKKVIINL